MDLLHIHLLLNHVPVVGMIGSAALLVAALVTRSRDLAIASLIALVIVALIALPVFFTGEPAEERVENVAGINKAAIEQHEHAAKLALIAIEIGGALALLSLIAFALRRRVPVVGAAATLLVCLAGAVLVARAANLGGEIRHTELGTAAAAVPGGQAEEDHD